eukprot:SAG22_NODE_21652_length_255_cov_0.666667_2_plen_25_part_01
MSCCYELERFVEVNRYHHTMLSTA